MVRCLSDPLRARPSWELCQLNVSDEDSTVWPRESCHFWSQKLPTPSLWRGHYQTCPFCRTGNVTYPRNTLSSPLTIPATGFLFP